MPANLNTCVFRGEALRQLSGCGCSGPKNSWTCMNELSGVTECVHVPMPLRAVTKFGAIQACVECPCYEASPAPPPRLRSTPVKEARVITQTLPSIPPARLSKGPPDRAEKKEYVAGGPPDRKFKRLDRLAVDLVTAGGTG